MNVLRNNVVHMKLIEGNRITLHDHTKQNIIFHYTDDDDADHYINDNDMVNDDQLRSFL